MAYYDLGSGGDVTHNGNYAVYPQNTHIAGSNNARTLLRPAEHMAPATYNIWRNVNFGEERHPSNLGVREFMRNLYSSGINLVADDVVNLVTLPHEAIVAGVYWRVEAPQAGASVQLVRISDGADVGDPIDLSVAATGFVATGFMVDADNNDGIGMKIITWPALEEVNADGCGVYGACDDLTLCLTVNAFIWSPVAENFCKTDNCYGQNSTTPRDV